MEITTKVRLRIMLLMGKVFLQSRMDRYMRVIGRIIKDKGMGNRSMQMVMNT